MGKGHQEGFTLIELLVLMMVLTVILGLGVPAMGGMAANGRMTAAANDLMGSIRAARTQASLASVPVTLCASRNWEAATPQCSAEAGLLEGWIVFEDADGDASVGPGEAVLLVHGPIDDSIRLQAGTLSDGGKPQFLSFRSDGFPMEVGGRAGIRHIQLCDARGNRHVGGGRAAGRLISISAAGNAVLVSDPARLQGPTNPLGGC